MRQRRFQPLSELHGIVVRPEMHEEEARLLVEHMAVERGHLDAGPPLGEVSRPV